MKVLDLQCAQGHGFEGWFASEEDFQSQCARAMVQCPLCGQAQVHKKPSAPRLNLGSRLEPDRAAPAPPVGADAAQTAAWLALSRRILASTQDVGERFAEEARRMHYGETEERAIRGRTTLDQAHALLDEGISVMPMLLPEALKEPLQ